MLCRPGSRVFSPYCCTYAHQFCFHIGSRWHPLIRAMSCSCDSRCHGGSDAEVHASMARRRNSAG